jgi:hypothetical protein
MRAAAIDKVDDLSQRVLSFVCYKPLHQGV